MTLIPASKELLDIFMKKATGDKRLLPSHLSLVMAVFYFTETYSGIQVSRKKLMQFSRIKSISTYHRCMNDLTDFGYLEYTPSYHPILGSKIRIVADD